MKCYYNSIRPGMLREKSASYSPSLLLPFKDTYYLGQSNNISDKEEDPQENVTTDVTRTQPESTFNIEDSIAAQLSALAGGHVNQQIGASAGSRLGGVLGTLAGGTAAAKATYGLLDDIVLEVQNNKAKNIISNIKNTYESLPGQNATKLLTYKKTLRKLAKKFLLGKTPLSRRLQLIGAGLTLGGGLGTVTGGVAGHLSMKNNEPGRY